MYPAVLTSTYQRKLSTVPDADLDEAFQAYRARDKRRRSTFVKVDHTLVDTSTTHNNIVFISVIIGIIIVLVVLVSAYYHAILDPLDD